jgi:AbrB family looped-hinge helix DNA binding protein
MSQFRMVQENRDMTLMRVRSAAQLTLPAEVRKALKIKEGDYLEAEIVAGGVLLKPVAVVARKRAWERLQASVAKVRDMKPVLDEDVSAEEKRLAAQVTAARRKRRKHA